MKKSANIQAIEKRLIRFLKILKKFNKELISL